MFYRPPCTSALQKDSKILLIGHEESVSQLRETENEEKRFGQTGVCEVKFSLVFPIGHKIQD